MDNKRLTANERRQLVKLLRRTHDSRQYRRTLAVLEAGCGKPVAAIAKMLQVSRQSVYNWIGNFQHAHDAWRLADAPRSGRPVRCSEDAENLLQTLLKGTPQHHGYFATQWTVPLLQEQLWHGLGERYSARTVRRTLHRLGYI
jgi:transposase